MANNFHNIWLYYGIREHSPIIIENQETKETAKLIHKLNTTNFDLPSEETAISKMLCYNQSDLASKVSKKSL